MRKFCLFWILSPHGVCYISVKIVLRLDKSIIIEDIDNLFAKMSAVRLKRLKILKISKKSLVESLIAQYN